MLDGLWTCRCGGAGGTLYHRGCACGGRVHLHTCLTADEMASCVCDLCRVPFGVELTQALCQQARGLCVTPEDHHSCDMRCIAQLGPSLSLGCEAHMLCYICIRRLRGDLVDGSLLAIFLRIAQLQLKMRLYTRVARTVAAVHTLFGGDDCYKAELAAADAIVEVARHNSA